MRDSICCVGSVDASSSPPSMACACSSWAATRSASMADCRYNVSAATLATAFGVLLLGVCAVTVYDLLTA